MDSSNQFINCATICRHTTSLTMYVEKILLSLRHENGEIVCIIYMSRASKEDDKYEFSDPARSQNPGLVVEEEEEPKEGVEVKPEDEKKKKKTT
ncbi:hypothetical protein M5689_002912 [Euphorbia peplus]|nr:hypothetical protein M5689_002912 [Euphorbia peplus]